MLPRSEESAREPKPQPADFRNWRRWWDMNLGLVEEGSHAGQRSSRAWLRGWRWEFLIDEAEVDAGEEGLADLGPGFFLFGGFELVEEIFG